MLSVCCSKLSMKKIAVLTQGSHVPSTRFRWLQFEKQLIHNFGYKVSNLDSKSCSYRPLYSSRINWLTKSMLENLYRSIKSLDSDIIFLQRHMISPFYSFERLISGRYIFDVDDSIHLGKYGENANKIAMNSKLIIAGNDYLYNHYKQIAKCVILPTCVDTTRFIPRKSSSNKIIIGWSGSSSGFKFIRNIEPALSLLVDKYSNVFVEVIADRDYIPKYIPSNRIKNIRWTELDEVDQISKFDIGLMPLFDDQWSLGKCSLKMLTYMSCGIPVVVSPYGQNQKILNEAKCGIEATDTGSWLYALSYLIESADARLEMGMAGRELVVNKYSISKNINLLNYYISLATS